MTQRADTLDVLIVAAHPDDAEISVGGTILACVQQGCRVGIVDLTNGEPTPYGSPEIRAAETAAATRVLGVDWRENLQLPNRRVKNDLPSRAVLAEVFRRTRPQIVLAPYWEDAHPDHIAASQLVDAARFWAKLTKTDLPDQFKLRGEPYWPPKLYYYWSIHLRNHPQPAFVFDISNQLESKMNAVGCYHSQLVAGRPKDFPTALDDIRDRARYWGWAIGTAYGEPFACREEIGICDFNALTGSPKR
jgi:bacillithiol biosynthesis deacetylase BshB1